MSVWYEKGLRFQCTECGKCCHGAPGHIWVTQEEIIAIAEHLDLSVEIFMKRFTRNVNGRISLNELPQKDWACTFLKGKGCSIYSVRPKQCRTYPFWDGILESRKDWEEAARHCEGISHEAPLITLGEIERRRKNLPISNEG